MTFDLDSSKNDTLAYRIAELIRQNILIGEYLSGERIIEFKLSKALEVSQNTIRDALHLLEQAGWVIKKPRRGVYVREFTLKEIDEIFELALRIESLAITQMIQNLTKSGFAKLRAHIEAARSSRQQFLRSPAIQSLMSFHFEVARLSNTTFTSRWLEYLYIQITLLEVLRQRRNPVSMEELDIFIKAHQELLDAVEKRDEMRALNDLHSLITAYRNLLKYNTSRI